MSKLLGNYEKPCNHSKWEFIVYRCDYRDDSSRQIFINAWSNRVRQWLYTDDLSRLIQTIDFTDKDNRKLFGGATVKDVQEFPTAWIESEEAMTEQHNGPDYEFQLYPRYQHCIHVNADSLDGYLKYRNLSKKTRRVFLKPYRDCSILGQAAYLSIVERSWDSIVANAPELEGKEETEESNEEEDEPASI